MFVKCLGLMTSNHCSPGKEGTGKGRGQGRGWEGRTIYKVEHGGISPGKVMYTGKKRIELRLETSRSKTQENSESRAQEGHVPTCTVWIRKSTACMVSWAPGTTHSTNTKPAGGCFLLSGQGSGEGHAGGEISLRGPASLPLTHSRPPLTCSSSWDLHGSVHASSPAPVLPCPPVPSRTLPHPPMLSRALPHPPVPSRALLCPPVPSCALLHHFTPINLFPKLHVHLF